MCWQCSWTRLVVKSRAGVGLHALCWGDAMVAGSQHTTSSFPCLCASSPLAPKSQLPRLAELATALCQSRPAE